MDTLQESVTQCEQMLAQQARVVDSCSQQLARVRENALKHGVRVTALQASISATTGSSGGGGGGGGATGSATNGAAGSSNGGIDAM